MAEVYDRAVAKGHGEAEICQYRTWTDVKIAYGVVRRKKPVAHGRDAAATPGAKSSSGNARTAASPGGGETARPEAGSRGEGRDADATTGGEEFAETEDQDEVPEVKAETLWRLLDEVTDGSFDITEAEREAFAVFVAAVGDERSARVALYHVWKVI
jgi:hypothetical protein